MESFVMACAVFYFFTYRQLVEYSFHSQHFFLLLCRKAAISQFQIFFTVRNSITLESLVHFLSFFLFFLNQICEVACWYTNRHILC